MFKNLLYSVGLVFTFGFSAMAGEIKEIAIIGNSIRAHSPAPKIGWNNNWGMAASSQDKDYVHVLYKKVCDKLTKMQKDAPKLLLAGGVVEKDFAKWDANAVKTADIIIVQMGDNYRNPVNAEKLQQPYEAMLKDFKGSRDPIIICVSNWGINNKMLQLIRDAAKNKGAKFVPLDKLSADPQNSAKSEGNFPNASGGVNWHPGDRGMNAIAEAIWTVLEPEMDKVLAQ